MKRTIRRALPLILCLMLLAGAAFAEGGAQKRVYNCLAGDEAPAFATEELLEIVFPSVSSSDAAILRFGDEVLMIDSSYGVFVQNGVIPALKGMGITHIGTAFASHEHNDHMGGFAVLPGAGFTFGRMILTHENKLAQVSNQAIKAMKDHGAEIVKMQDGDSFWLGKARVEIIKRVVPHWYENDLSAMCMVTYGECRYLSAADLEERGQRKVAEDPPACGLKADILKYPHHGHDPMNQAFQAAVDPELVIIMGFIGSMQRSLERLDKMGVPWLRPWPDPIRMRTDGRIWVVDRPDFFTPAE